MCRRAGQSLKAVYSTRFEPGDDSPRLCSYVEQCTHDQNNNGLGSTQLSPFAPPPAGNFPSAALHRQRTYAGCYPLSSPPKASSRTYHSRHQKERPNNLLLYFFINLHRYRRHRSLSLTTTFNGHLKTRASVAAFAATTHSLPTNLPPRI